MNYSISNRNKSVLAQTEIAGGSCDKSFFPACLKSEKDFDCFYFGVIHFLKIS